MGMPISTDWLVGCFWGVVVVGAAFGAIIFALIRREIAVEEAEREDRRRAQAADRSPRS